MKKNVIFTICICILLTSLTGCGAKPDEEAVTTTLPVKASETVLVTESQEVGEEEITETTGTENVISNIENNVDDTIDLSLVNVNNTYASINSDLKTFTDSLNIKRCPWYSILNEDEELYFVGNGYGIPTDPDDPTSFEGTLLGIECYFGMELARSVDDNQMEVYNIKAVRTSTADTKDDFKISFYNGITIGNNVDEVTGLLGVGSDESVNPLTIKRYYKNTNNTLLIVFKNGIADEIYLFNNKITWYTLAEK